MPRSPFLGLLVSWVQPWILSTGPALLAAQKYPAVIVRDDCLVSDRVDVDAIERDHRLDTCDRSIARKYLSRAIPHPCKLDASPVDSVV